ncbi:MAG TPA: FtsX-like permease family protein [Vicinamibacteria bacterium]|nr:FtsX-like permease family protein [Vicinamibacteria bacterium]
MAVREARATAPRLAALAGAVAVGVAALVAIHSFTANLLAEVREEARALLGADLAVSSASPYSVRATTLLSELRAAAGPGAAEAARVTSLVAMAHAPGRARTRLVQLAAVEPGYPFFGSIETEPPGMWPRLAARGGAIVDPSLLAALEASLGDTVRIGDAAFPILATVKNLPGDVAIRAVLGPRVFVPADRLDATGLVVAGSRVRYETFYRLPEGAHPQRLADRFRGPLAAERVSVRTVSEEERRLQGTLGRLGRYLSLVALLALLMGGLGVASGVRVFVKRKLETVAVLRCLGAGARQVLAVYLLLVAAAGLAGGVVGALCGAAIQGLLPRVLGDFLPVRVPTVLAPSVAAVGVGFGLWIALAFAAIPLLAIRRVAPLRVLRRPVEAVGPSPRDPAVLAAAAALAATIVLLSMLEAGAVSIGLGFSGGIAVVLGLLWLTALGLIRALRLFPQRLPYLWRQGLANLHRPANQTVAVVLALGFGTFLLATLLLARHNLLRDLRPGLVEDRPNLVFFDVQEDQRDALAALLRSHGAPVGEAVPVVPMRIAKVKGRAVAETLGAATSAEEVRGRWALRREYRSSYRDRLGPEERVIAGRFWSGPVTGDGPVPVSLERGVARELGVGVGDAIEWDVQGVSLPSRVASLREVEWARFEPNFFAVFPTGPLDGAPQTFVTLTRLGDVDRRARLQHAVVEVFPNVSSLDFADVQRTVEGILERAASAIGFMALFSLGAGGVVLAGALAQSRFERVREGVLLRTLGASRSQIVRVLVVEYAGLGLLAVTVALGLAVSAGAALARFLFDVPFALPWTPLLGLAAFVLALTLGFGLTASRPVFRQTPIELLRTE